MPYDEVDAIEALGALFEMPSPPRMVVQPFTSGDPQIDEALEGFPYWVKQEVSTFWQTGQIKSSLLTKVNDSLAFRDGMVFLNGKVIKRPS
jgi:hypothetical protein